MENVTIPQHIVDKANSAISKGTKMTFDEIVAMFMKSEAKAAKKSKDNSKWDQRAKVANTTTTRTAAEINRENAINNAPSSLR